MKAAIVVVDWAEKTAFEGYDKERRFDKPRQSESVDIHWMNNRFEVVNIPEDGIWSASLSHPDRPHGARPPVAGRTWVTDVSLRIQDHDVIFGCRTIAVSEPFVDAPVACSKPRLINQMANKVGIGNMLKHTGTVWDVADYNTMVELKRFLLSPHRKCPVILVTDSFSDTLISPQVLANNVQGMAYVMHMKEDLCMDWGDLIGGSWCAYHGAIRTYNKGLDLENSFIHFHPLWLATSIKKYQQSNRRPNAVEMTIMAQVIESAASQKMDWSEFVFTPEELKIERRNNRNSHLKKASLEVGGADRALLADVENVYAKEIKATQEEASIYKDMAVEFEREKTNALEANQVLQEELKQQRTMNDLLRLQLQRAGIDFKSEIHIPDNLDELEWWCEHNLSGLLAIHPRARKGLKGAQYKDVDHVYRCLLMLAYEYRDMRLGKDGAKGAYDQLCMDLKIEIERSITKAQLGAYASAYTLKWPIGSKHNQVMDIHIRNKTSTRDPKRCLAIYFFWEPEKKMCVIGWLPSHRENQLT